MASKVISITLLKTNFFQFKKDYFQIIFMEEYHTILKCYNIITVWYYITIL